MKFEVDAGGERRVVELRRTGDVWEVGIDGRWVSADVTRVGDRWSLLLGTPGQEQAGPLTWDKDAGSRPPAKSFELSVQAVAPGEYLVRVNGIEVPVTVADPRRTLSRHGREGGAAQGASGRASIVAPMPGRIVNVLVRAGDTVSARQPLVVVEAMKMENELRAPRAGIVADVRVTPGMLVEANSVLVVVE